MSSDLGIAAVSGAVAAACAWQGFFCGNGKAGLIARFDEIHLDGPDLSDELLVHHKLQRTFLKNLVIVLWLIQSQSQRGAASAALH